MNFIKRVFDGKHDDKIHLQFQKFSRGEFKDRAIIIAKQSKDKITVSTSPEFGNELVEAVSKKLGNNKTLVIGAIVSTSDFTGKIDFKEKKQFQGVKRYVIEKEMSGNEIIKLVNEFPKAFFGLSFSTQDGTILKIKPKAPKSGKPGTKAEDAPKADFCKLITSDFELGRSFIFEKPNFEKAEIKHDFVITDIVIPEHLKNEKDFAKVREGALRKGKIIRTSNLDGNVIVSEKQMEA